MPARLCIDFAVAAARESRSGMVLLGIGVAAALGVLVWAHHLQSELVRVQAQTRTGARNLALAPATPVADPAAARAAAARVGGANRVLVALGQPWSRLFADLESAHGEGVALLALEPDAARASVRLSGEASDLDALSRYLQQLSRLPSLADVRLVQHETSEGAGRTLLRFTVVARWAGRT